MATKTKTLRAKATAMVVATESFHWGDLFIPKGQLVRASHPVVKAASSFFGPAEAELRPEIEETTAAPGTERE